MTKINDEQAALLKDVAKVKAKTDEALAELEATHATERYYAEAPLRLAVENAVTAGVPLRQIGKFALNTLDYATVRRYLPPKLEGVADVVEKPKTAKSKPVIEALAENLYIVKDAFDSEWEFWTLDFDGHTVVERSNNTKRGANTFTHPVPLEVMQVLKKRFPKADFDAIDKEES